LKIFTPALDLERINRSHIMLLPKT
jgi:hypothetical protein